MTVSWSVADRAGGGETLRIEWREENGPPVAPPQRSGFGSELIKFSIKQALGGTVETHFEPEGFRGVFNVPIG